MDTKRSSLLSDEINTATRSLHTNLNRLITTRLPLALPPHAPSPTPYTTGLLHFSYIYLTFESLWTDLTSPSSPPRPSSPLLSSLLENPYDTPSSPPAEAMLRFLTHLRPKGLARSTRLRTDLSTLTNLPSTDLSVLLSQYPGPAVADYCSHIRKTVREKPHTLVAYAWCYYMAVFSGGRWIRAQLSGAGNDFWGNSEGDKDAGLALWNFPGDQDGEDIKAEFKARLAEAEALFTVEQRIDVIEEAKNIFKYSAGLVEELDRRLGTDMELLEQINRRERKISKAPSIAAESGSVNTQPLLASRKDVLAWLRRPEITGLIVALGCLLYMIYIR